MAVNLSRRFRPRRVQPRPGRHGRARLDREPPLPDGGFDAAPAQLAVHFIASPVAGLPETGRATRQGSAGRRVFLGSLRRRFGAAAYGLTTRSTRSIRLAERVGAPRPAARVGARDFRGLVGALRARRRDNGRRGRRDWPRARRATPRSLPRSAPARAVTIDARPEANHAAEPLDSWRAGSETRVSLRVRN